MLFQCLYFIDAVLYRYAVWHKNQFSTIVLEDPNAISKLSFYFSSEIFYRNDYTMHPIGYHYQIKILSNVVISTISLFGIILFRMNPSNSSYASSALRSTALFALSRVDVPL